jgi:hypothetical protein
VTAGQHATGGATAAFGTGLSHAMTVVAAVLVICAAVVAVLGDRRSPARKNVRDQQTPGHLVSNPNDL